MSQKLPKAVLEAQAAVAKHESEMTQAQPQQPAAPVNPAEQAPAAHPQAQPMSELAKMEQKIKSFEGRINRVNNEKSALEQILRERESEINRLETMLREKNAVAQAPASVLLDEERAMLGPEIEAPLARIKEQQLKQLADLEKRYEQRVGTIEKQTEEYKAELYRGRLQSIIPNIFEINASETFKDWLVQLIPGSSQTHNDVITGYDRIKDVNGVVSKFREFLSTPEGAEFKASGSTMPTNPSEHIQPRVIEGGYEGAASGEARPTKEGYAQFTKRVTQGFYTRRPEAYAKDSKYWDAALSTGVLN